MSMMNSKLKLASPRRLIAQHSLFSPSSRASHPSASRTFVVLGGVGHKGVRLIPHLGRVAEPQVSCDFVNLDAGSLLRFRIGFEWDVGALAGQLTHALALDGGDLEKEDHDGEDQAGKEGGEREYIDS